MSAVSGATPEDGTQDDHEDIPETITLYICSMDPQSLDKASARLDQFQEEEFKSEVLINSKIILVCNCMVDSTLGSS